MYLHSRSPFVYRTIIDIIAYIAKTIHAQHVIPSIAVMQIHITSCSLSKNFLIVVRSFIVRCPVQSTTQPHRSPRGTARQRSTNNSQKRTRLRLTFPKGCSSSKSLFSFVRSFRLVNKLPNIAFPRKQNTLVYCTLLPL